MTHRKTRRHLYGAVLEALEQRSLLTAATFHLQPWIDFVNQPFLLASGDVNHDGKPDVVALVSSDGGASAEVHVLLGDGTTLSDINGQVPAPANATPLSADPSARSMLIADVNGDGFGDVLVDSPATDAVEVYLSKGDGFLKQPVSTQIGAVANFAVADVNHDGKPDLIAGSNVYAGNGDGTFAAPVKVSQLTPGLVAIADVNGDGNPDIISATTDSKVEIALGDGNGTFQTPTVFNDGISSPKQIAVADLNGDKHADVAVLGNDGTVSVLLNDASGAMRKATTYATGSNPGYMLVADFAGTGRPEIDVSAGLSDPTDYVLTNKGDGTFIATANPTGEFGHLSAVTGDFNGDGKLDYARTRTDALAVFINTTQTVSTSPQPTPSSKLIAPTHVTASTSKAGQIRLSWTASTKATAYVIFRSTSKNFASAKRVAVLATTSMADKTVKSGKRYYYWVRARTSTQHSGVSAMASGIAKK